jgi:DNA-binding response OmpR family regulator
MRHRILVVAADVSLRSTLARWLMPAGYFVELAETERRAREVLADQRMALTIVAPSAGVPMFDPGEKGGKLIIASEQPHDPGRLSRSAPVADAYLSIPLDQQEVLAQVESVLRPSPGADNAALPVPKICPSMALRSTWPGARCVTAAAARCRWRAPSLRCLSYWRATPAACCRAISCSMRRSAAGPSPMIAASTCW